MSYWSFTLGLKCASLLTFPYDLIVGLAIGVLLVLIVVLESGVQFIQAYVFTLLTCSYMNIILYLDH